MNNHSHNIHFIAKWLKVRFQFTNTCNLQARCANKTASRRASVYRGFGQFPSQTHGILRDTVNKRAVRILLECILVFKNYFIIHFHVLLGFCLQNLMCFLNFYFPVVFLELLHFVWQNSCLTSLGSYKRSKKLSSTSISWYLVDLVTVSEVLQLACRPLKIKPKVLRNKQVLSIKLNFVKK